MSILDLVFRWMHIFPAIGLAGGTLFLRFVYLPSLSELPEEKRQALDATVRSRWAKIVAISAMLLIISGLFNGVMKIKQYDLPGLYHGLLAGKIMLGLAVFFIASLLSGRTSVAEKIRQKASFWLTLNVVLVVLLIGMAGAMKLTDGPKKQKKSAESSQAAPSHPAGG